MTSATFKIRRTLLIPFAVNVVLLSILLCLSLFFRGSFPERVVLAALLLPALLFFLEALNRSAATSDQGIVIRKWMRKRELRWEDITHVGCLAIRRKIYLLLTTTKGFHILSNAYDRFPALAGEIAGRVGADKTDEEVKRQVENSARNAADMISLWFAAIVIAGILVMKLWVH